MGCSSCTVGSYFCVPSSVKSPSKLGTVLSGSWSWDLLRPRTMFLCTLLCCNYPFSLTSKVFFLVDNVSLALPAFMPALLALFSFTCIAMVVATWLDCRVGSGWSNVVPMSSGGAGLTKVGTEGAFCTPKEVSFEAVCCPICYTLLSESEALLSCRTVPCIC